MNSTAWLQLQFLSYQTCTSEPSYPDKNQKASFSAIKSSSLILSDFTAICGYCSGRHITTNGLNLSGVYWHVLLCIRRTLPPSGGD